MSAYRCPVCLVNWPHSSEYGKCPECGEVTDFCSNVDPLEASEAKSRKSHADFERWLDDNNRRDPVEILERQIAA